MVDWSLSCDREEAGPSREQGAHGHLRPSGPHSHLHAVSVGLLGAWPAWCRVFGSHDSRQRGCRLLGDKAEAPRHKPPSPASAHHQRSCVVRAWDHHLRSLRALACPRTATPEPLQGPARGCWLQLRATPQWLHWRFLPHEVAWTRLPCDCDSAAGLASQWPCGWELETP